MQEDPVKPLRALVVGTGAMGRHHARVLHELPDVELAGLVDSDVERAGDLARRFGTRAFSSVDQAVTAIRPDFAVVAVPTALHVSVSGTLLELGVHVLVEKPIASTIEDAVALVALAEKLGLILGVGHIERFNPAVVELKRRLEAGEIGAYFLVHARRLGPFPPRITDVGVVTDLATHDIDLFNLLCASEPVRVYAQVGKRLLSAHEDLVSGVLTYPEDRVCVLDVNWLTPTKIRELFVTGERGMFHVNYLTQDIYLYRNNYAVSSWDSLATFAGVSEGDMTRLAISREEPLRGELRAFVTAVREARPAPVTGHDGLAALRVARRVLDAGSRHLVT